MKKYIILLFGFLSFQSSFAQGYKISMKINGLQCPEELILANHYGDKQYARDTSSCKNGIFVFEGKEKLESGVYLAVLPNRNHFEFMVSINEDQSKYYFENDTNLRPGAMIVKGSKENEAFFEFNKYASDMGLKAAKIKAQMDAATEPAEKKKFEDELITIGKEVSETRNEIISKYPDLFLSKLYRGMQEVKLPEQTPPNIKEDDIDAFNYIYLRTHYWDNIDFSEDGLVRSPVFHNKLKNYFDNYVPPIPDTAIMIADGLINAMEQSGGKEQFKYTIHYLLRYFQELKYMCFDKATYYIVSTYYCSGRAFWADSAFRADMCERSAKMAPTICGVVAPDMNMPDTSYRKRIRMSDIDKPVTILVFWTPDCGHCRKEMPVLKEFYDSCNKEEVEIYAVYTQGDWEGWKDYIKENKLNFINVADAFGEDKYRKKYDIISTPQIYVLDRNKEIIFKKVGAKDLPGIVEHILELEGNSNATKPILLEEEHHD